MDDDQILAQRLANLKNEPPNHERYKKKLLAVFPDEIPSCDLFFPNTFDGNDRLYYLRSLSLFENKKWFEVDLNQLYKTFTNLTCLTTAGEIYYLPTFLLYFWELKHLDLEYFDCFIDFIDGVVVEWELGSDEMHRKFDYTKFETLTIEQAKLIATFLVNTANLLPDDYFLSLQAQRALNNYWGRFLFSSIEKVN